MRSPGRHRQNPYLRHLRTGIVTATGLTVAAAAALATTLLGGGPSSPRGSAHADAATIADPPGALQRASRGHRRLRAVPHAKRRSRSAALRRTTRAGRDSVIGRGACEASFYGSGGGTADGSSQDPDALTAAHRTLPMGSRVRVTNARTGLSVVVRINDRGPFVPGRCLDLSVAAMRAIKGTVSGVVLVRYEILAGT